MRAAAWYVRSGGASPIGFPWIQVIVSEEIISGILEINGVVYQAIEYECR